MIISEISKMSVHERIQTMEALWDSLNHEQVEITSPDWHGDILSARAKKNEDGKGQFKSLEELKSKNK